MTRFVHCQSAEDTSWIKKACCQAYPRKCTARTRHNCWTEFAPNQAAGTFDAALYRLACWVVGPTWTKRAGLDCYASDVSINNTILPIINPRIAPIKSRLSHGVPSTDSNPASPWLRSAPNIPARTKGRIFWGRSGQSMP